MEFSSILWYYFNTQTPNDKENPHTNIHISLEKMENNSKIKNELVGTNPIKYKTRYIDI